MVFGSCLGLCIRLVDIYSMKPLKRPIRVAAEFVFGI